MADAVGNGGSDASVLSDASESLSETEEPTPKDTEESGPSGTKESGPSETEESGSNETKESGSSGTEEPGQSMRKHTRKRVRRVSKWKKTTRKRRLHLEGSEVLGANQQSPPRRPKGQHGNINLFVLPTASRRKCPQVSTLESVYIGN